MKEYEYHVQPVASMIDFSYVSEISPITNKTRHIGPIPNIYVVETIQDLRALREKQMDLIKSEEL